MDVNQLTDLCRSRWGLENDQESALRIRERRKRREPETRANEIPLMVSVKEMPAYDPDMELRGLTPKIPTWIMAIARVRKTIDQSTDQGKAQLAQSLMKLETEIDDLLGVIEHG